MNILGMGPAELVVILLIALIVAGPKRMVQWMYLLGRGVSRLRVMWDEMMEVVQSEIDEAGLDVKVPRELPTRQNLNKAARDMLNPMTKPMEEAMDEVKQVGGELKNTRKQLEDEAKGIVNDSTQVGKEVQQEVKNTWANNRRNEPIGQPRGGTHGGNGSTTTVKPTTPQSEFGTWANPDTDSSARSSTPDEPETPDSDSESQSSGS